MDFVSGKQWNASGKNCFVTGGSQGLGLALSLLLAKNGANVTLVARDVNKLEMAVSKLEECRISPDQTFRYHSFPLNTSTGAQAAVDAECDALSKQDNGTITVPDAFFLCAGSSHPGFFVEQDEKHLLYSMEQAYWVQAWSAHAAMQRYMQCAAADSRSRSASRRPQRGKILFVGSTLSLMSFLGYASYTPGKHALKGLAETLRSEGLLYDVNVQIFYGPTINSPGYLEEIKTKPKLTAEFEADDRILSCEEAARAVLSQAESGDFHGTATLMQVLLNSMSRGSAPVSRPFLSPIADCLAWIAMPFWRRDCDSKVRRHQEEHFEYLERNGLLSNNSKKTD